LGCDIHLYVEKRVEGKWIAADKWIEENEGTDEEPDVRLTVPYDNRVYSGRCYDLFSILADVRNGYGFAGIKTGAGFNPICPPKGLPDDVSPEVKQWSDHWDSDGHSHSWHTVADLLAYDWTQTTTKTGSVDLSNFENWDRWRREKDEAPMEYCGSVSGLLVKYLEIDQMQELAKQLRELSRLEQQSFVKKHEHTYCEVQWTTAYHKSCPHFWSEAMPRLLRFGKPEDVRIVFWFDN